MNFGRCILGSNGGAGKELGTQFYSALPPLRGNGRKNEKNERSQGISRRSFLAGAGILAASSGVFTAGCGPKKASEKSNASSATSTTSEPSNTSDTSAVWQLKEVGEPDEVVQADVAIVGAGGTGTAAAIPAVDLGLKPIIVERLQGYGGSFVGTEGMTALETKYTRDNPPYLSSAIIPTNPMV